MRKSQLNRRLFLKGAGSTLIGLPILEECLGNKAFAQDSIPTRCLTMSFGLGIEQALQDEQWNGPLEPFRDLAPKMAFFSNLENDSLRGGGTVHFEVGATLFTGVKQDGTLQAGGPSMEQIMRMALHPNGVPSVTGVPSMSAGIWSRTGRITQYVRHWNQNGSAGMSPERRPSQVFDRLFGNYDPNSNNNNNNDPELEIERRIRRSVLDSVIDQANTLTSSNSYLGADSKARINAHLDTIRSIERELIEGDLADDEITNTEPPADLPQASDYTDPSGIGFYDAPSGPITGPITHWENAQRAFRLSGKLFALGFQMDALRFGSLVFIGAGEHIRFDGTYNATNIGRSLNFGNTFSSSSPHDKIFHTYVRDAVRVYQHYVVSQLAYVLKEMDSLVEANGRTVLDNTLTVIGTEYGRNHEGSGNIFHAIAGGNGNFRAGQYDNRYGFNDVYKTALDAYGINHNISGNTISSVLA